MTTLGQHIRPWSGQAYRHIPAGRGYDVRDLRYARRRSSGRWHWEGQPTLYLASDAGVALGEFARHLAVDRAGAPLPARRIVYELGVRIERAVDLRDPAVLRLIGREDAPGCWLDVRIARAVGTFFRDSLGVQGLLVPSITHLGERERFNVVAFLENLPDEPRAFLPRARKRATVAVEPEPPSEEP